MPARRSNKNLYLPSLAIKGFRGIADLSIPRLGRVTLFVGKNGVGKTTLLDAIRVCAARGRYRVLSRILRNREELMDAVDEDGEEITVTNWESLFHGRHAASEAPISIGPMGDPKQLRIETVALSEEEATRRMRRILDDSSDDDVKALKIEFQGTKQKIPIPILNSSAPLLHARQRLWDGESRLPPESDASLWDRVY